MSRLKKALEKAKEARGDAATATAQRLEAFPPAEESGQPQRHNPFRPLRPDYQDTRVIACDIATLRRNRVISVCTEDEASKLKILRTQIIDRIAADGKNTFLVTSANPGEGKTLTAINLAISFSHQINKTVPVDEFVPAAVLTGVDDFDLWHRVLLPNGMRGFTDRCRTAVKRDMETQEP